MKKIISILALFVIVFFCNQEALLFSQNSNTTYTIKPGDTLEISVYDEPDLNKTVKVSEDGKITYPFIGEITVVGFNVKEAATNIGELLEKEYLVNPQVSIFVREYSKFYLVGKVNREGGYELKGNLTLLDAIALAGGAKESADLSKIKVVRKENNVEREYILNLETQGRDFLINSSDRIIVGEYGKVSVLGEVNRPGNYYLTKDAALLDVVALAGGAKEDADVTKIKVERQEQKGINAYIINLDQQGKSFLLKNNDTVFVTAYKQFSVLGQVKKPGSYDFKRGITVTDAIARAGGFTETANQNAVRVIREEIKGKRQTFNVPVGYLLKSGDKSKDILLGEGDVVMVDEGFF
ncbi:MAG: SLBB domain-containing protein [Candidatus Omnitrophota bacterium]